jgi:hypothetical protein
MKTPPNSVFVISYVVALLMIVASLAGLFFPSVVYPTESLRRAFLANDVVNLLIGLPILLVSMRLARSGRLIGLLFWPGALFYVTYNYIAYAVAMPWTLPFVLFLSLVILSAYAIFCLFSSMDLATVQSQLKGKVTERLCGGVLAGFGALFFLRGVAQLIQGTVSGAEEAVVIADLFTMPFWVIGGLMLWSKRPFGYASGAGLLFQASTLFIGLLVFFILQPFVSSVPFPLADFVVILVMGLICFIPFGIFVRGIMK